MEFAKRIAAALPAHEAVSCEVRNLSSLRSGEASRFEQGLKAELQDLGIQLLATSDATTSIGVTLSENVQGFIVFTGEIRRGQTSRVLVTQAAQPLEIRPDDPGPRVTLRSEKFWKAPERILDAAIMNLPNGVPILVLLFADHLRIAGDATSIASRVSFPPVSSVLRDPTGVMIQSGNEVTARLVQQVCVVALDTRNLVECHPTEGPGGRADAFLQLVPGGAPRPEWGSQIAEIQAACGNGHQFLVTGPGDYTQRDFLQLYESNAASDAPSGKPLSNALNFSGPVLSLHAAEKGATAIVHNLETGAYEAHHISVACE